MPLFWWVHHFLDSRAEICQIFRCFFVKSMTPKRHSEINWPLVTSKISGKFLQIFVPFSENLNFTRPTLLSNGLSGYKEFSQYSSESVSQFSDPLPELVFALFGIHFHICICSWATRKLFWIESPLLLCIFH